MKKPCHPPRFFPEVLQAVYELKETGGSNSNRIVSHVKSNLNQLKSLSTQRNLSTQVRRALKHATTNGILKQRAGKFRINAAILDPYRDCAECRRRKREEKKRRRRRRRRHRRHAVGPRLRSHSERSDSEGYRHRTDDSESDDLPIRELRRRRRRNGKSRRRRRRRRRSAHDQENVQKKNEENTACDVYPDDHRDGEENYQDDRQCDNPECLCNVKEEIEDMQNLDPPE